MSKASVTLEDRPVVAPVRRLAEETGLPAAAIQLPDGRVVTGKTSTLLGASSAALLNALKALGGIHDAIHLISPIVIEPIQKLKTTHLGSVNPLLHTDEILLALSICAATNPTAELALRQLPKLRHCEAHSSVTVSYTHLDVYKRQGWHRLSKGFMEFTSMRTHFSPRSSVSSGLPRPRLWPGTSKGTTRRFSNSCSAS